MGAESIKGLQHFVGKLESILIGTGSAINQMLMRDLVSSPLKLELETLDKEKLKVYFDSQNIPPATLIAIELPMNLVSQIELPIFPASIKATRKAIQYQLDIETPYRLEDIEFSLSFPTPKTNSVLVTIIEKQKLNNLLDVLATIKIPIIGVFVQSQSTSRVNALWQPALMKKISLLVSHSLTHIRYIVGSTLIAAAICLVLTLQNNAIQKELDITQQQTNKLVEFLNNKHPEFWATVLKKRARDGYFLETWHFLAETLNGKAIITKVNYQTKRLQIWGQANDKQSLIELASDLNYSTLVFLDNPDPNKAKTNVRFVMVIDLPLAEKAAQRESNGSSGGSDEL